MRDTIMKSFNVMGTTQGGFLSFQVQSSTGSTSSQQTSPRFKTMSKRNNNKGNGGLGNLSISAINRSCDIEQKESNSPVDPAVRVSVSVQMEQEKVKLTRISKIK